MCMRKPPTLRCHAGRDAFCAAGGLQRLRRRLAALQQVHRLQLLRLLLLLLLQLLKAALGPGARRL